MKERFQITVNDVVHNIECDPKCMLIDILRENLRLTGTKRGCGIGVCGTCTVLIDGKPKMSCKVNIEEVAKNSSKILTIEGLSKDGKLHPIQQAFIDCGAIQCGFCTPGMVLTAKALLDRNPHPTRDEIKKALAANLCRCTGYQQIFESIEAATRKINL